MNTDSILRCKTCGRQQGVNFADCLRSGFPVCHGETMALVEQPSEQAIKEAVHAALEHDPDAVIRAIKQSFRLEE